MGFPETDAVVEVTSAHVLKSADVPAMAVMAGVDKGSVFVRLVVAWQGSDSKIRVRLDTHLFCNCPQSHTDIMHLRTGRSTRR